MSRYDVFSVEDPRIAPYRDLPCRGPRQHKNLFIAEGSLLIQRLLASDYTTDSVLIEARRYESIAPSVPPDTPVYVAPRQLMREIVGFKFHHGVMACGRRKPPLTLPGVLPANHKRLVIVACVDIQDPENMGVVLRNCAAFGVDVVLVNPNCASPFSRRVLRVSMGAVLSLPIVESSDLDQDLTQLRDQQHVQLAAAVLDPRADPLDTAERPDRLAILFGNEASGLGPQWLAHCDRQITIPMHDRTDSLNVAVASGIFLHHFARRDVR